MQSVMILYAMFQHSVREVSFICQFTVTPRDPVVVITMETLVNKLHFLLE